MRGTGGGAGAVEDVDVMHFWPNTYGLMILECRWLVLRVGGRYVQSRRTSSQRDAFSPYIYHTT
jgi:hypothetical protein